MFIVPFIHKVVNQNTLQINVIKLLTIGGCELWEEDNGLNIDKDVLNPNDIYRSKTQQKASKQLNFCEVDTQKTKINDFYMWEDIEADSDTFCWRTFIYLTDLAGSNWLEIPETEKLGKFLVRDLIKSIVQKK